MLSLLCEHFNKIILKNEVGLDVLRLSEFHLKMYVCTENLLAAPPKRNDLVFRGWGPCCRG